MANSSSALRLTPAQERLADFLRRTLDELRSRPDPEPYNECFVSEAEARFAHGIWALALHGRAQRFPGDKQDAPTGGRRVNEPNSIFERVKAAVSVEELAGRFTGLRPVAHGKLKGLCPIHDERTPSFRIDQERQRWHCFGACARGGDVITLAQELMDRGKL